MDKVTVKELKEYLALHDDKTEICVYDNNGKVTSIANWDFWTHGKGIGQIIFRMEA